MTTTKKVPGALVGVNLRTAGHLADALQQAAGALAQQAAVARTLAPVATPAGPAAVRLEELAAWAAAEAAAVRHLVERLDREVGGLGGPARWSGAGDRAFAHPVAAVRRAEAVLAALARGDLAAAGRLLAEHGEDPVLATVLVERLGVDGVLAHLRLGLATWARPSAVAERAVVVGLADALARAHRHGTAAVDAPALAERADELGVPRTALALLFVGGARFPAGFVRDAVRSVLAAGPTVWMIPAAGAPLDARVVVLDAAAADPRAARSTVGSVDLDDLLPGELSYADGGVALARVLLEATRPLDGRGGPVVGPLTTRTAVTPGLAGINAQRVIEWIGEHRTVPLAVHAELGHLAEPWIGSFRAASLDRRVARHLPLDEGRARSFLAYAAAREEVADDLRSAAWRWAAAEVDELAGPGFDGTGFDAVGSVLGLVTTGVLDAEAAQSVDDDRRARRRAALWHQVTGLVAARVPGAGRLVANRLAAATVERALPAADAELTHWREGRDAAVVHESAALDHLVAGALWRRRGVNGHLRRVPSALLVDPADPDLGLRPALDLTAAERVVWDRWRSGPAARGAAPLQLAGDRFLLETRR